MRTFLYLFGIGGLLLAAAVPAQARIKLTTLPERESVRIDIQNGRYTLVEEERTVNLQAGRNQVDFSWANINIDKDSIVFRIIKADGEVNVLNTNYPPNENALYWTVSAEKAGPAVVRISYLIANMAAEPSYQGVVENDEKKLLLQVYMTVTNTSGESFGECAIQPGVGKTTVRYFNDGERKRMLAAKFAEVPVAKRYVFDAAVDQEKTRMYYRLTNDKENQMGGFPCPMARSASSSRSRRPTATRSAARLFWARIGPSIRRLFAPLDLYVGTAQDVKVERFQMDPEGGVRNAFDELTAPRFTIDGKEGVTKPLFRNVRSRVRYRLQNFKTEKGDPITVPLTIKEHVDGQWIIEKVVLKEILGERNEQKEKEIPYPPLFTEKRIDVNNVEYEVKLPPTTIDKKYDLVRDDVEDVRPLAPATGCAVKCPGPPQRFGGNVSSGSTWTFSRRHRPARSCPRRSASPGICRAGRRCVSARPSLPGCRHPGPRAARRCRPPRGSRIGTEPLPRPGSIRARGSRQPVVGWQRAWPLVAGPPCFPPPCNRGKPTPCSARAR